MVRDGQEAGTGSEGGMCGSVGWLSVLPGQWADRMATTARQGLLFWVHAAPASDVLQDSGRLQLNGPCCAQKTWTPPDIGGYIGIRTLGPCTKNKQDWATMTATTITVRWTLAGISWR